MLCNRDEHNWHETTVIDGPWTFETWECLACGGRDCQDCDGQGCSDCASRCIHDACSCFGCNGAGVVNA